MPQLSLVSPLKSEAMSWFTRQRPHLCSGGQETELDSRKKEKEESRVPVHVTTSRQIFNHFILIDYFLSRQQNNFPGLSTIKIEADGLAMRIVTVSRFNLERRRLSGGTAKSCFGGLGLVPQKPSSAV